MSRPELDFTPLAGVWSALPARGITEETCRRFDYRVGSYRNRPVQIANYCIDFGVVAGQKLRFPDKEFMVRGDISKHLFGKHLCRDGGRRIIITEGEIDCMTVSQVLDHKWQVVSIPNGAKAARKALAANLDWLNAFEQIVLCFDMDEPGQAAVKECVSLFPPGKVRVVALPGGFKDPNDMLKAGEVEALVRALWDAKQYRPDGIVTVADIREKVVTPPQMGIPWAWPSLSLATYGRRYGECVGVGAGTGMGKTTLLTQQIAFDLRLGHKVAIFALEQSPAETVKYIAGMQSGKLFVVPEGWTQEELEEAVDNIEGLYLYDHFGATDWDIIKERIRYLCHAHGVKLFYLDHLTALAAACEDERVGLERIMAEIASLVKELDIWLLFVSHLSTPEGAPHEEGGRVKIRHFKGSRAIGYWAHFMFGLERNQQSEDEMERNTTILRVLKDRPTGRSTGMTFPLTYDRETGRLSEGTPEFKPDIDDGGF